MLTGSGLAAGDKESEVASAGPWAQGHWHSPQSQKPACPE